MKNSMKLNVLSLVVALSAAQAEAGVWNPFRRTPAPKLLPVAPVVTPSAPTSKWDMVTTAASTFGGTIATGAKSLYTKAAAKAAAGKVATTAFVKANATKLAAAPLKTKVAVGLGSAVVAAGAGYGVYKVYKAYTKPSDKAKTPVKSEKQAEAKPGYIARAKAWVNAKLGRTAPASAPKMDKAPVKQEPVVKRTKADVQKDINARVAELAKTGDMSLMQSDAKLAQLRNEKELAA